MLYRPGQQIPQPGSGAPGLHLEQQITNPGPLPFPTEAKLDQTGEPVTLLQVCDWQGHSPANVGVDKRGKQFVATFDEITVTDQRIVPNPAIDALRSGRQVA